VSRHRCVPAIEKAQLPCHAYGSPCSPAIQKPDFIYFTGKKIGDMRLITGADCDPGCQSLDAGAKNSTIQRTSQQEGSLYTGELAIDGI
jgi:hypothetical protein